MISNNVNVLRSEPSLPVLEKQTMFALRAKCEINTVTGTLIWYDTILYDIWYVLIRYMVRYEIWYMIWYMILYMIWYDPIRYDMIYDMIWWCHAIRCDTTQHETINIIQFNIIHHMNTYYTTHRNANQRNATTPHHKTQPNKTNTITEAKTADHWVLQEIYIHWHTNRWVSHQQHEIMFQIYSYQPLAQIDNPQTYSLQYWLYKHPSVWQPQQCTCYVCTGYHMFLGHCVWWYCPRYLLRLCTWTIFFFKYMLKAAVLYGMQ